MLKSAGLSSGVAQRDGLQSLAEALESQIWDLLPGVQPLLNELTAD